MHDYLVSLLLGVIEGLTEFLPVSSTAHLRIAQAVAGIDLSDGYWKMYTIVIQLGAVLCLPLYFRGRIEAFVSTFPRGPRGDRTALTHPLGLALVAFLVTAVPAYLLTSVIGKHLESLTVMGTSLVAGGIVMWLVDLLHGPTRAPRARGRSRVRTCDLEDMGLMQAVWVGACQVLAALFPGVSRSMATISAGQLAGMSRAAALEFSFFVSIPTMIAATAYDLLKSVHGTGANPIGVTQIDAHGWIVLAIGFLSSFLVAYATVAWFMAWVRRRGFAPFAAYRIVLGALVLALAAKVAR